MFHTKYLGSYLLILLAFSLCSCKKVVDVIACVDCTQKYASEKKIKTIQVTDNGVATNYYEFYYKNGLLDSISFQPKGKANVTYEYHVFYAKNTCTPSGFEVRVGYTADGIAEIAYQTDGKRILAALLPGGDVKKYYYDSKGRVWGVYYRSRLDYGSPALSMGMAYDDATENVTGAFMDQEDTHFVDSIVYDKKNNPFHLQDNILYYLEIFPFNVMLNDNAQVAPGYNLFLNMFLSKSNAKSFEFGDNSYGHYPYTGYRLQYSYNGAGYPLKITVYSANLDVYPGTPIVYKNQEQVDITYY